MLFLVAPFSVLSIGSSPFPFPAICLKPSFFLFIQILSFLVLLVLTLYLLSKMEVLDLIARTENSSWIDASLELLSNQSVLNTNSWILLVKLITYKNIFG